MKKLTFSHIVAASLNNVIGNQNELPWHIPEDLKFFRSKTKNHPVIMGRKTFDSLGSPLPKRINIIISRSPQKSDLPNVYWTSHLDEAMQIAQEVSDKEEVFIIGGGEIYKQSLHKVQKIYLTRIYQKYEGDVFYPEVPLEKFQLVEEKKQEGNPAFSFLTYEKIS